MQSMKLSLKPGFPSKWAPSSGFFWFAQSRRLRKAINCPSLRDEEKEYFLICFLITSVLVRDVLWVINLRMAHSCGWRTLSFKTHHLYLSHFALQTASHGIPCSSALRHSWDSGFWEIPAFVFPEQQSPAHHSTVQASNNLTKLQNHKQSERDK